MKKFVCMLLVTCSCLLGGCFNYNDIDKVIFATAVIIDVDENGNPVLYVEAFKPERSVNATIGSSQRILFRGSKKTLFETIRDINMSSSYKLNYTQTRGIIFTERAAEKNMYDFVDIFERDQEFVIRSSIVVLNGDADTFIKTVLKEQEYVGVFLNDLIHNIPVSSRAVITILNDFLNSIYTSQGICVLPIVELKSDQPEAKIQINGGAVIKKCKMVDTLQVEDGLGYNFLTDNVKGGSLEVTNPNSTGNFVSLEILKSKTRTWTHLKGKDIDVKKVINLKCSVAETQRKINLNNDTIKKLQYEAESNIEDACNKVFEKYKLKKLDIFNISDNINRRYPKANIGSAIENSHMELEVHVELEGSSDKTNFRN